ncbi:hypothetical protein ACTQ9L_14415 [Deinococcus wulumuqiensis]
MTEAKPKVTVYDLTQQVPKDVTLSGLSAPKFDGVNYFRQPLGQSSSLRFKVPGSRFVQLEYQLYSPESAVSGQVQLDGQVIGQATFPAGKFVTNSIGGGFLDEGEHQFSINYSCVPACQQPPSQYWTKLTVIEDARVKAREDTGLGTERLWLNAPGSELRIQGAGPVTFDGVNYRRPIEASAFTLSWPAHKQALSAGFTLHSNQPFRVTARVGDTVLSRKRGDARTAVQPTLNLLEHPQAQSVTVQVECLTDGQPCASLYFPSVNVLSPTPVTQNLTLALPAALLLLLGAAGLLGFPSLRR